MQGLIGLTEEPAFWMKLPEFAALAPYAAHKCTAKGAVFDSPPGKYLLLAGEADTFAARGNYSSNGVRRTIAIAAGDPLVDVDLRAADLKESFPCISCPYLAFLDSEGHELPPLVLLRYRLGLDHAGTDRIPVTNVPLRGGRVHARVIEVEHEVTHLDSLALEVDGVLIKPTALALMPGDGMEVVLQRNRVIDVEFDIPPALGDLRRATLVAGGYYAGEEP